MPDVFLRYAKAWAALIGALVQVVIPFLDINDSTTRWFQIGFALLTVLAVYQVPNKPVYGDVQSLRRGPDAQLGGPGDPGV